MKLEQVLREATERQDREIRETVVSLFQEVAGRFRDNQIIDIFEGYLSGDEGIILNVSHIAEGPLLIILVSGGNPTEGGYVRNVQGKPAIVLYGFPDIYDLNLTDPQDLEQVFNILIDNKRIFVHEMIHVVDDLRSSGRMPRSGDASSSEEYFNNPTEVNAYYQEAIQEFDDRLNMYIDQLEDSGKSQDQIERVLSAQFGFNKDFEEAFEIFKRHLNDGSGITRYLNDDNWRRIRKRFYNYWIENLQDE